MTSKNKNCVTVSTYYCNSVHTDAQKAFHPELLHLIDKNWTKTIIYNVPVFTGK